MRGPGLPDVSASVLVGTELPGHHVEVLLGQDRGDGLEPRGKLLDVEHVGGVLKKDPRLDDR